MNKRPDTDYNPKNPLSFLSDELLAEIKRIELRTRKNVSSDLMGSYRSAFRGTGLVFSDLREYMPGDEVRNIHWKATARSQRAYVKTFDEDRQLQIHLLVDTSSSTLSGAPISRHRSALEFSALVALMAYRSQDSIGLSLFSDRLETILPPRNNRAQLQRILLTLLQEKTFRPATALAEVLDDFIGYQRKAAVVFLVSDFYCPPFDSQLKKLSLKHDVVLVMLENDPERLVPNAGLVQFRDAESGEMVTIDTSSAFVRQRLRRNFDERLQSLSSLARTCGVDMIRIQENPIRPLFQLMQQRTARLR